MVSSASVRATMFAVAAVATAALSPTANAGPQPAAVTTTNTTAKGEVVGLSAESTRQLTCADGSSGQELTSLFVLARTNVTREGSTRVTTKDVATFLSTFESCGNTAVFWSGFTDTPANLAVRTGSATLTASVPLVSQSTTSTRTANLSLTFAAVEAPVRTRNNATAMFADTRFTFRGASSSSDATVTGSVTVDGGPNLIAGSASVFASLEANSTSTLTVARAQSQIPSATIITQPMYGPQVAATTTTSTSDRGERADVSVVKAVELTCADGSRGAEFTNLFVIARTNVVRAGSTRQTVKAVEVLVSRFETCGSTGVSAFGSTDSPDYAQKGADSAAVSAPLRLFDLVTGTPAGDVNLSLAFQATTPAVRTRIRSMSTAPEGMFMSRSEGMFSEASVTGTVTIDGGPNLLIGSTTTFALLGTNTTSVLSLIRAPHRTP